MAASPRSRASIIHPPFNARCEFSPDQMYPSNRMPRMSLRHAGRLHQSFLGCPIDPIHYLYHNLELLASKPDFPGLAQSRTPTT